MEAQEFIGKWRSSKLKERSASQSHFNDLCALLSEPTPTEADPQGDWYTFERGAKKTGGGDGWADVWKRRYFAWEYKGKHAKLDAAFAQLQRYAIALENPPLLIVSDMETIRVHTNYTNTVQEVHVIDLDDLARYEKRQILKWAFAEPERLKPGVTREAVTEKAAKQFAELAQRLRNRGFEPQRVAHFVTKLLFCMFAEDIGLLPCNLFTRILETGSENPENFPDLASDLFTAMKDGGNFGADLVDWFNGGLFDHIDVLPLDKGDIAQTLKVARQDWSDIEPSIFGTLFERGLDPSNRSQLGAHYTDRHSIMRIVEPVVLEPLSREWEQVKSEIQGQVTKAEKAKSKSVSTKALKEARRLYQGFLLRLREFRVLDPACGSGNFLYLALLNLKDLEHRVILEAETLGLYREFPEVGPSAVLGIELNPYAAELARVTIWIGQIQWMLRYGFNLSKKPILQNLDQIACQNAVLSEEGAEPEWPHTDCIVGNPPFLGDKKMLSELGDDYVVSLRNTYKGRVPGGADYVTYWFEKARAQVEAGKAQCAGLVATNSIRGGANRKVLERIRDTGVIFNAWSDEPWILEGAAVRVSLVGFAGKDDPAALAAHLDGKAVGKIYADLTAATEHEVVDLTEVVKLSENVGVSFIGTQKNGPFDVPGHLARKWLRLPGNPNARPNSDVLRPWVNGMDITRRPRGMWIIDFGVDMPEEEAAFYEVPFEHVVAHVEPTRKHLRRKNHRVYWWRYGETRPGMRRAIEPLSRYIATSIVSKHRAFVWMPTIVLPENLVVAIARDDDTTFGIVSSRFHETWALRMGTSLEDRPRYTPTTTFETYPFPNGLTPNIPASQYAKDPRAQAIAEATRNLNQLRENWLNPPEWVKRVPEVVSCYPDRLVLIDEKAAGELKKRTLTNLYNKKPQWLVQAHNMLDEAVAAAYGWEPDISDEEALTRLFELNQVRAGREREITTRRSGSASFRMRTDTR